MRLALAVGLIGCVSAWSQIPPLPAVLPPTNYPVYYFAATAQDTNGEQSEFSVEIAWTNITKTGRITLGWDYPYTNWPVTNFVIWQGRQSRTYTNTFNAGTNHSLTFPLVLIPTNIVVHVGSQNATNLQYSHFDTEWHLAMSTSLTLTNPQTNLRLRAMGTSTNQRPKIWVWPTYY